MATGTDVLSMLRPQGGWAIIGDEYENAQFFECEPVSKQEFETSFAKADEWIEQQKKEKENKKIAAITKLQNLGLTTEDLRAIGL